MTRDEDQSFITNVTSQINDLEERPRNHCVKSFMCSVLGMRWPVCLWKDYGILHPMFQDNIFPLCVGFAHVLSDFPGSPLLFPRWPLGCNQVFLYERGQEGGDIHGTHTEKYSQTKEGYSRSENGLGREFKVSRDRDGSHSAQGKNSQIIENMPCLHPLKITGRTVISCLELEQASSKKQRRTSLIRSA